MINEKTLEYIEKHDYKSVIESHNSSNRKSLNLRDKYGRNYNEIRKQNNNKISNNS